MIWQSSVESNLSIAAELLNVELIHLYPATDIHVIVWVWVGLVCFNDPRYDKDSQGIVHQNHQFLHGGYSICTLFRIHRPSRNSPFCFSKEPISARSVLNFLLGGKVAKWETWRSKVITAQLIQVAGQIIQLWIPQAEFVVNKKKLSVVLVWGQNIELTHIVVREHFWPIRDQSSQFGLVTISQKGVLHKS